MQLFHWLIIFYLLFLFRLILKRVSVSFPGTLFSSAFPVFINPLPISISSFLKWISRFGPIDHNSYSFSLFRTPIKCTPCFYLSSLNDTIISFDLCQMKSRTKNKVIVHFLYYLHSFCFPCMNILFDVCNVKTLRWRHTNWCQKAICFV